MWGRYGDAVCIREMARPGRAGPDGAMTLGLGAQRARIGDRRDSTHTRARCSQGSVV